MGKYIAEKAFIVRHNERNAPLKNGRFLGIVHDYCKSTNEYRYYRDNKLYDQNRENSGNCDFHHHVSYFMLLFCVESIFSKSRFMASWDRKPAERNQFPSRGFGHKQKSILIVFVT